MLGELLAKPEVTEVCELRGRFGMMALHGGNLERTTDVVAAEVARRTDASYYAVIQAPPIREHLASTAFDPAASEALASFLSFVDVVIAIHGYGRKDQWHDLLLGGRNRDLARHLADHLRTGLPEPYRVVDELEQIPKPLRGQHPDNPVNLPVQRGAQLELPPTIRWNYQARGWSDHQGVPRSPDVDLLIDALTLAVHTWRDSSDRPHGR
ncbi:MAG: poly-gamma-glutamate hydrolase family protein [Myxococcota bacterium]|nr:poly-gamma-glutamate hydrolase family protein [Myxococcota bacterium]